MKKILTIIIALALFGCTKMSKEEKRIADFLNSKLKDIPAEVSKVEIIGEDSVLSLTPMKDMHFECELHPDVDSVFLKLNEYFYKTTTAREYVQMGQPKDQDLSSKYPYYWRRILKVKTTGDDIVNNNDMEVIFDNYNSDQMMTGAEYDTELSLWETKIKTLPQNNPG
jgi:hypothetical protein